MSTTTTTVRDGLVTLKGGRVVSVGALYVLWDLEARGFDVRLGDGRRYKVLVGPSARLTSQDKSAIHVHRDALAELVSYCEVIT